MTFSSMRAATKAWAASAPSVGVQAQQPDCRLPERSPAWNSGSRPWPRPGPAPDPVGALPGQAQAQVRIQRQRKVRGPAARGGLVLSDRVQARADSPGDSLADFQALGVRRSQGVCGPVVVAARQQGRQVFDSVGEKQLSVAAGQAAVAGRLVQQGEGPAGLGRAGDRGVEDLLFGAFGPAALCAFAMSLLMSKAFVTRARSEPQAGAPDVSPRPGSGGSPSGPHNMFWPPAKQRPLGLTRGASRSSASRSIFVRDNNVDQALKSPEEERCSAKARSAK